MTTVANQDLNEIDGPAYYLAFGERFPYDRDTEGEAAPTADWAHRAARGVLAELGCRGGISDALDGIDHDIRCEIVQALAGVIREAKPSSEEA